MRAKAVPGYMAEMVAELNKELAASGRMLYNPWMLAARYHHQSVNIHPFGDGNGRTARIFMNVLLLQCTRVVSEIGVEEKERKEYIDVVTRGAKVFREEDMEVAFGEHMGHKELAELVSRKRVGAEVEGGMEVD